MENTIIENFDENQNSNQGNTGTESTNAKNRIRLNHLTPKQKQVLMSGGTAFAGLMLGAGAFSLMGFANKDGEAIAPTVTEDATECVDVYTDAPVSTAVSNEMSFSEAFEAARDQVGAGGFFEYKGELYNTYTKEEWETMSETDQQDYASSMAGKIHTTQDVVIDYPESGEHHPVTHNAPEHVAGTEEFDAPDLVSEADVINRVDVGSDYSIDMYEVDFDKDGKRDFVVDADGDGKFDELVIDLDKNSSVEEGDYIDIAALDTSKLTNVNIVDGDGNLLEIHDEPAIDKQTGVANKGMELESEELTEGMDLNQDGRDESFVINANDNYVDDIAIDIDQSGTIDEVILDVENIETDERIQKIFAEQEIVVEAEDYAEIETQDILEEDTIDETESLDNTIASNDLTDDITNDLASDDLASDLDDDILLEDI